MTDKIVVNEQLVKRILLKLEAIIKQADGVLQADMLLIGMLFKHYGLSFQDE